jgi:hypothetical protein
MNQLLGMMPGPDQEVPLWTVGPFIALLLSIAIVPLVFPHWWHKNRNKAILAVAFGIPSLAISLVYEPHAVGHTALEYLAFVCLLGSLFTISGGVRVAGSLAGTPLANTAVLGLGAILANLVGTPRCFSSGPTSVPTVAGSPGFTWWSSLSSLSPTAAVA